MRTYLIIDSDRDHRLTEIEKIAKTLGISPFDQIFPESDTPSIGIGDTRVFTKRLSLLPDHGTFRAGIIAEADRLTLEAQQSLLKTLEEPPSFAYIFLGAANTSQLIPTILSRCLIIQRTNHTSETNEETRDQVRVLLAKIMSSSNGEKLRLLQGIGKTKEAYIPWIDLAIESLRNELIGLVSSHKNSTAAESQKITILHRLTHVKQYLPNNVNPLLLIENAFLSPLP